jgi:oxygen-independent coproporphyrinogen-3 oxidase
MSIAGNLPSWRQGTFSLYVHVPFCRRKCPYCHFYVLPYRDRDLAILDGALRAEWAMRHPQTSGLRLASLYFGGGTPALVPPQTLASWIRLFTADIPCEPDLEITLEGNPEDLSASLLGAFAEAGINRLSVGVQSFVDEELRALGRAHSAQQAIETVHGAQIAGISNISIDLMFETPGQTLESWTSSLHQAMDLPISHLSLYNLTIEPHTAFDRRRTQLEPLLPSAEQGARMLERALATTEQGVFSRYELSAFCRGDKWSKHNTGYWLGRPFFGLGPSSWSFWGGRRFRNLPRLHRYAALVQEGLETVDETEQLPAAALRREMLAVQLRLVQGVDSSEFQKQWGEFDPGLQHDLKRLIRLGMLEDRHARLHLTERGQQLHDSVAAELIAAPESRSSV